MNEQDIERDGGWIIEDQLLQAATSVMSNYAAVC